jgi:hypothetical protein
MIVDFDAVRSRETLKLIRQAVEEMCISDRVITTTVAEAFMAEKDLVIFYGYRHDDDLSIIAEAYADIISEKTGLDVIMIPSSCYTVARENGRRQWAGHLAVHAGSDRMDGIIEKLKGRMDPGKGFLSVTTFDVEKYLLDEPLTGDDMARLACFGSDEPYVVLIFDEDDETLRKLTGKIRLAVDRKVFVRKTSFITACDME